MIEAGGKNLITLGADDDVPETNHVGAYSLAADLDRSPVLGWQVEEEEEA